MDIVNLIVSKIDLPEFIENYTGVKLHRSSNGWRGCCPIHGGMNSNSLFVDNKGTYYCYACNSAGTVINFLADYDHITYTAALERLATKLNINLSEDKDYQKAKSVEAEMTVIKEKAKAHVDNVMQYLTEKRGFTEETIKDFELGSDNGKVVIPLRDINGRTVAVAYRRFSGKPKYINSYNNELYDKSAFLFNLDGASRMVKDKIYVVEGYMDAMSGHQLGLPTIAYCGNELQRDQIKTVTKYIRKDVTIVIVPDNDERGMMRLPRVRDYFKAICPNRQVRVALVPDSCKDMNDMLLAGINPAELPTVHIDRFVIDYLLKDCNTEEEKYHMVEEYLPTVTSGLIRMDIIKEMADNWGKDYETLKKYFDTVGEDTDDILSEASDVNGCVQDLMAIYKTGGYPTHFQQIDNCIRRVEKKQVIIAGAEPGVGKTDFAIEYTLRQICREGLRVIFFSLEMPKGKLVERILAKLIGCNVTQVEDYLNNNTEVIKKVLTKLEEHLIVFDGNHLSIDDIAKRIELVNSKNVMGVPADMVIVDYFGYMSGTDTFDEASNSARKMKGIAKANNLIFVMLSQLNRSPNFEEPTMQRLKSTGDLEASADYILLLWRPARNPNLSLEEQQQMDGVIRMKIDKARDGFFGPSLCEFTYNKETSRWVENYA